jgi:hypothetical protein
VPGAPGTVLVRAAAGAGRLNAADVTRALATREIYLAELVWQRPDLEEVFLNLTAEDHLGAGVQHAPPPPPLPPAAGPRRSGGQS